MKTSIRTMMTPMVAALVIAACTTVTANHDFNPAVNFDQYKTFSWVSPNPLVDPSPSANPSLERLIEQTARELLSAKGYRFVEDAADADFVVGFGIGATDKVRAAAYPEAYRGQWHWHAGHEVSAHQHSEGRLVVDIFDVRSHQPAWHGSASRTIDVSGGKDPQPAVREALTLILANFPPG